VEEALKESKDAVVADLDAAEVLQPSVGAFDFPAAFVASEFASIFIASLSIVARIGHHIARNHTVRGVRVSWKSVTAVMEAWYLQFVH
jgi:spore germination cell wall hydrolase CwlJ-like protein